jgi:glutathione S-transferase
MAAPITLYTDYGCPFAQRVEALLVHHDVGYRRLVVEASDKPDELLRLSPTGRLPLVTIGELTLYETTVIADYFAEQLDWREAYPEPPEGRAQHRIAIRRLEELWISSVLEVTDTALEPKRAQRVEEDLEQLECTLTAWPSDRPCMLELAAVPMWLRWTWMAGTGMAARIDARPALANRLKMAAAIPALLATTPDANRTVEIHGQSARSAHAP